jgi:hypothetical protein
MIPQQILHMSTFCCLCYNLSSSNENVHLQALLLRTTMTSTQDKHVQCEDHSDVDTRQKRPMLKTNPITMWQGRRMKNNFSDQSRNHVPTNVHSCVKTSAQSVYHFHMQDEMDRCISHESVQLPFLAIIRDIKIKQAIEVLTMHAPPMTKA